MSKDFGKNERKIKSLFKLGEKFAWNGVAYKILLVDKPTCEKGEPKTDIYVKVENLDKEIVEEIKISYKQKNADFLENKMDAERAEQLFGSKWQQLVKNSLETIKEKMLSKELIYKNNHAKTAKGAITLGWKFELLNVESGNFSGKMKLTREQIIDVYSGTNLSDDKRNAKINGERVSNSGIAEYILVDNEEIVTVEDVVNNLVKIEDYVDKVPEIFFACKALNYRTFENKFDGNRPLAVYVDWKVENNKLTPTLIFNNPLNVRGNEVAEKLLRALSILKINNTDDINVNNINDMSKVYN